MKRRMDRLHKAVKAAVQTRLMEETHLSTAECINMSYNDDEKVIINTERINDRSMAIEATEPGKEKRRFIVQVSEPD